MLKNEDKYFSFSHFLFSQDLQVPWAQAPRPPGGEVRQEAQDRGLVRALSNEQEHEPGQSSVISKEKKPINMYSITFLGRWIFCFAA